MRGQTAPSISAWIALARCRQFVLRFSALLSLLSFLVLGFALGMRHATDPDHVVAVTAIVTRERSFRAAAPIGALWGLGHTFTIFVVGGAIVLFGFVIPPRLGLGMEFSVGLMLVGLGAFNLLVLSRRTPAGPHALHAHSDHSHDVWSARAGLTDPARRSFWLRPMIVGLVHGLAGSAAVALLVLGRVQEPLWSVAFLAVFGVGTVAGMLLVTLAMALPLALTAHHFARFHRALGVVAALSSVGFGLFLAYDTGIQDGLFSENPTWTPE